MSAKRGLWLAVLTIGFAMVVFGAMPNCAVAGRDAPAVTLPGPDCIWFMWGWWGGGDHYGPGESGSSDSSDNGDEGEDLFDEHFRSEKNPTW